MSRLPLLPVLLLAPLLCAGCSGLVANIAADSLSGDGQAFRSDDDPELVREAIPFGLKVIDSLLESSPDNPKLLLAAASSYAQYSYAFVQQDAVELEEKDPAAARAALLRAKKLFRRAVRHGLHGLEVECGDGFLDGFARDPRAAVRECGKDEVPLLYWTGAALALQISLSKDDMVMVGRLREVEALMDRAFALDPDWGEGSIHEFYVTYDTSRSEATGGGVKKAQGHFDRARAISGGKKVGPLVSWAEAVAVPAQDKKLFDQLLDQALAFDVDEEPRFRLVNLIAQRRARFLKARAGDLFLEE